MLLKYIAIQTTASLLCKFQQSGETKKCNQDRPHS